jgi:hypothetical protein
MSEQDCIACGGEGGHPETGACGRCEGSGIEPPEMVPPEEPPPHTDADAPPGTEVQPGYPIERDDDPDENALRERLFDFMPH